MTTEATFLFTMYVFTCVKLIVMICQEFTCDPHTQTLTLPHWLFPFLKENTLAASKCTYTVCGKEEKFFFSEKKKS